MVNKLTGFLFDRTGVGNSKRFLDLVSFRHKLIAGNVANVSTPGYKTSDVNFQNELDRIGKDPSKLAGTTTHASHMPLSNHPDRAPEVHRERVRSDELNSVDIDREVPKMAQNELQYTIAARLLEMKFQGLKKAISGN